MCSVFNSNDQISEDNFAQSGDIPEESEPQQTPWIVLHQPRSPKDNTRRDCCSPHHTVSIILMPTRRKRAFILENSLSNNMGVVDAIPEKPNQWREYEKRKPGGPDNHGLSKAFDKVSHCQHAITGDVTGSHAIKSWLRGFLRSKPDFTSIDLGLSHWSCILSLLQQRSLQASLFQAIVSGETSPGQPFPEKSSCC